MECPAFIADNIKEYQQKFDEWLYDKANDHGYWVTSDMQKTSPENSYGVSFNGAAFVDWLNRFVLHDNVEKAKLISTHHIEERNEKGHAKYPDGYNYPHIFF
jgi:hypothetical protein